MDFKNTLLERQEKIRQEFERAKKYLIELDGAFKEINNLLSLLETKEKTMEENTNPVVEETPVTTDEQVSEPTPSDEVSTPESN